MPVHRKPVQPQTRLKRPRLIYLDDELVGAIDQWRQHQEGEPSRSDAIRRLTRRAINADAESASV